MKSKFTAGPWKVDGSSIRAKFEGEEVQICLISTTRWSNPDGGKNLRLAIESEANARLIAASPTMHKAIEEFVAFDWEHSNCHWPTIAMWISRFQNVLNEAERREEK